MISCPICNFSTDFLTSKENRFNDLYEYFICKKCGFLFEKDLVLNSKNLEKKVSNIYQNDYFQKIDSGWKMRGDGASKLINKFLRLYGFIKIKKNLTVLDYGGGNGYITSKINSDFDVFYYDKYEKPKYLANYKILSPQGGSPFAGENSVKADVIYAVELVEHFTDIKEWNFLRELCPDVFIFTTGLSDGINDKELLNWEYLNADAGHTAIYSLSSLYLLAKKYGFVYFFFPNRSFHIFFRNRFLSKINFVKIEYCIYKFIKKVKHIFNRPVA